MAYTHRNFANGTTPLNPTTFQPMEDRIKEMSDLLDPLGTYYASPRARYATDSDIGQAQTLAGADNTAVAVPAGGTWVVTAAFYRRISDSVLFNGLSAGSVVFAGGSTVLAGASGYSAVVVCKKES